MKHLFSIQDFIFEAIETYEFKLSSDTNKIVKYTFSDMNDNKYLVEFKNITRLKAGKKDLSTEYELAYFVYDNDTKFWSVSKIVNTNLYSTLKTIFGGIMQDFTKRKSWVKKISMHGLSKNIEKDFISQRTKVYLRYLERNPIPGYKLDYHGLNSINLVKT